MFRKGDTVRNPKAPEWGEGQVLKVCYDKLTVSFDKVGEKVMKSDYIEKIADKITIVSERSFKQKDKPSFMQNGDIYSMNGTQPIVSYERPYLKCRADEMLTLANNSEDPSLILALLHEMQFRSTNRAHTVRELLLDRLDWVRSQSFKWPTTEALIGDDQLEEDVFQHPQGLLGWSGYRVGITGLAPGSRKQILDRVYQNPLPIVNSKDYMQEWGEPRTGPRLRKMAESIAAFARNAKRRDAERLKVAIYEWEEDLAYLKNKYYEGRYDFIWPDTHY